MPVRQHLLVEDAHQIAVDIDIVHHVESTDRFRHKPVDAAIGVAINPNVPFPGRLDADSPEPIGRSPIRQPAAVRTIDA